MAEKKYLESDVLKFEAPQEYTGVFKETRGDIMFLMEKSQMLDWLKANAIEDKTLKHRFVLFDKCYTATISFQIVPRVSEEIRRRERKPYDGEKAEYTERVSLTINPYNAIPCKLEEILFNLDFILPEFDDPEIPYQ